MKMRTQATRKMRKKAVTTETAFCSGQGVHGDVEVELV